MEGFKNGKPDLTKMKELKKLKDKNKAMGGKGLKVVEDMQTLYYYNQFVDEHYKSRDCVPISLKKVIATKKELKSLTRRLTTIVFNIFYFLKHAPVYWKYYNFNGKLCSFNKDIKIL